MYNIAVIGCGVIGLTSALEIQKKLKHSVNIHIFTEDVSPNTTGDVSAGLWTPYLLKDTPMDSILNWSNATLEYCLDLWKKGFANEAGICIQPMTAVDIEHTTEPVQWLPLTLGYQILSDEQINKINSDLKTNYKSGVTYVTVTCEPTKFLPFLKKKFIENGGSITLKKITDIEQLSSYDIIVNCSGLYSKILVNDDNLKSIRGQVMRVKAPWVYGSFTEIHTHTYIIANSDSIILGGTAQDDNNDLEININDRKEILKNCSEVIPSLKNAHILAESVGLRPGRDQVRLEFELLKTKTKTLKVIHNYGHGGSGVTLCYGCALEVAELVENALTSLSSKL